MAVLRGPAVLVGQHNAIAALIAPGNILTKLAGRNVRHAVAKTGHGAWSGCKDVDALTLLIRARKAEVGSTVAFIRLRAALEILRVRRRVGVDVILNEAAFSD